MPPIKLLENWLDKQCDGDWEHEYGLKIESLDNPGWKLMVSLTRTGLCEKEFNPIDIERTTSDWIYCEKRESVFYGYGGIKNLEEIIEVFIEFTGTNT